MKNGVATPLQIPNTGINKVQKVIRTGSVREGLHAFRIEPDPGVKLDSVSAFLSYESFVAVPEALRLVEINKLHRIENPKIHSPDTLDCASCHLVTNRRLRIEEIFNSQNGWALDRFQSSSFPLTREGTKAPASLRAFGYFGSRASISQRTINESAAIADYLNQMSFLAQ